MPVDSDVVLKDEVLFAIEPSLLEYQFNEPDIVPSSVSEAVPVNVTDDPTVTWLLSAGAVMVTVGATSASIVTDTVDEPTLPSVSVTFAVIVCVPIDSDVVLKEAELL